MKTFAISLLVLAAFSFTTSITAYKLNVPKVLLPNRASKLVPPINYTLEITDLPIGRAACFKWKSSRPEVVEVYPIYDKGNEKLECSTSAIVSAVSEHSIRRTAIVSAEDTHSTSILRCDVMVDSISSIEIVTTTRQLYLEDSPELFIVRAYNNEGDTFTDLDGLSFDWKVESAVQILSEETKHWSSPPARIVSFHESEYEATAAVRRLESQGFQGNRILVEGRATGVAKITVHGRDHLSTISPYTIQLTVMAFLTLEPSADIRVPVGSRIYYSLKLIRYRKAENVPLPSAQYRIFLKTVEPEGGSDVARFDDKTSTLEARALGAVQLLVEDRKLEIALASYDLPSAYVYVVDPTSIVFTVSTGEWVFEVGRSYEVHVGLVDFYGRHLFIADNVMLDVSCPLSLLESVQLTKNGTVWRVTAKKEGAGEIEAKYGSYIDSAGVHRQMEPQLEGSRSFEIYLPMSLSPSVLVFPPCYETPTSDWSACFEDRLHVNGGSGQFMWSLEQANFSTTGNIAKFKVQSAKEREAIVATFHGGPTKALVVATDVRNRFHKAEAKVIVAKPVKAELIDGPRDVEIGSRLDLHLRIFGSIQMSSEQLLPFTDCSHMIFDIHQSHDAALDFLNPETIGTNGIDDTTADGCVMLPFMARTVGDVALTIRVTPLGGTADMALTVIADISVYAPLRMIHPPENVLMLTPTSSYGVIFTGGPRRLISDPSSHFVAVERLGKTAEDYLEITSATEHDLSNEKLQAYTFTAQCASGMPVPLEVSLLISVGNKKSAKITHPALSSVSLKIICDFPTGLYLQLKDKTKGSANISPCPFSGLSDLDARPVYSGENFDLLVDSFDNAGRRFDNFSALQLVWQISDKLMLQPSQGKSHHLQWRRSEDSSKVFECYENFHPSGTEGLVKVTVAVAGIAKDACSRKQHKTCEELVKRALKASIVLRLASYVALSKKTVALYNHPRNRFLLDIQGGSGRFSVFADKSNLVSWTIFDGSEKLELVPIDGDGETELKLYDNCLIESPPATALIIVSSLEKLALSGPSLIMIGTRLTLHVHAFDKNGHALAINDIFDLLPMDVHIEGQGLRKSSTRNVTKGTLQFEAANTGVVSIFVSVTDPKSGTIIRSAPHRVQIFPTFEIEPRIVTLVATARFQLRISGGLHHTSSVVFIDPAANGVTFSVNDTKLVSVRGDGLLEAKRPGTVSIIARLTNPEEASNILAEDKAIIHIVRLTSIRIHAPTTLVYSGAVIPLTFIGSGDRRNVGSNVDPSNFNIVFPWGTASADFPIKATWSVEGDGADLGWNDVDYLAGAVRLNCSKPGLIHVRLSVEQPNAELAKLQFASSIVQQRSAVNASATITVVDWLRLVGPEMWRHYGSFPARLLMGPSSVTDLRVTAPLRNVKYSVYEDDKNLVEVDDNGILRSTTNSIMGDVIIGVKGYRTDVPDWLETAAIVVSVRPVSYLHMSSPYLLHWHHHSKQAAVYPVHYIVKLFVDFYDNRGLRFDVSKSSNIAFRPNRFDLVDITLSSDKNRSTIVVHLKEIGETVIKIWDMDHPNTLFDFIRIKAVQAIHPSTVRVPIGHRICFTNILSRSIDGFYWGSTDQKVMEINQVTGLAFAKLPGDTIISQTYRKSGFEELVTSTSVAVLEPTSIFLERIGDLTFLTEFDDDMEYLFAIRFNSDVSPIVTDCSSNADEMPFLINTFPFSCELEILPSSTEATYFHIEPIYSPKTGFGCVIRKQSPKALLSPSASIDWTVDRNVSVWVRRGAVVSSRLTLPIHKSIMVQPSELLIDNEQSSKSKLRIFAPNKERLDHIKVTLSPDAIGIFALDPRSPHAARKEQNQNAMWKKEYILQLRADGAIDLTHCGGSMRRTDFHVAILDERAGYTRRIPIRLRILVKSTGEDAFGGGILGFIWNILVGSKEVYGTVLLMLASAVVTISGVYFGYRFLISGLKRTYDGALMPPTAPAVSPASIPWRSYGAGRQLWSVDRSQSPASSNGSPVLQSPGTPWMRR